MNLKPKEKNGLANCLNVSIFVSFFISPSPPASPSPFPSPLSPPHPVSPPTSLSSPSSPSPPPSCPSPPPHIFLSLSFDFKYHLSLIFR